CEDRRQIPRGRENGSEAEGQERREQETIKIQRTWVSVKEKMTLVRQLVHSPSPRAVLCNPTDELYLLPHLDDASLAFLLPALPSLSGSAMRRLLVAAALWTRVKEAKLPANLFLDKMLQATEHETEVALLSCVFSFLQTALLNFIPEPLFHPVADRVSHLALVRAAGGAVASTAPMLRSFPCLCSPAHSPLARASFGVSLASAPSVSGNLRPLSVRAFWMDVAVQTAFTPAALLRLLHLLHFQDVLLGRLAFRPASAKSPHSNASTSAAFSSADKHETRGNKRASNARGLTPEGSSWMTGKKRQEQEEICGEQRGNKGEAAGDMSQFSELSLLECLKTRRRADDETQTGRRGSVAGPSGVHTTGTGWKEQAKRELEKPRCRQAFVGRSLSRGERGKIESFSRSRALALVSDSERRPRRARTSSRQSSSIAFHGVPRSPSFPFLPCCGVLPPFVCETCLEHAGERRKMFPQPFCLASSHR
ncbi:hypothetical protein TGP89_420250, partial [Toxoplasma gondii p89]